MIIRISSKAIEFLTSLKVQLYTHWLVQVKGEATFASPFAFVTVKIMDTLCHFVPHRCSFVYIEKDIDRLSEIWYDILNTT